VIVLTITQQTSGCTLVQTDKTKVLHNPEGRTARSTINILRNLTLDLQTNLDNLEGVGEDLRRKRLLI